MAKYDRAAPWYWGEDGQAYQAENDGSGWVFPHAPRGEDGLEVRYVEDPGVIQRRKVEMLGYDPDDRQVNQDGSRGVQIRNPRTGQYEQGVITEDGLEMPLGLAQEQGKKIMQGMVDPQGIGGSPFSQVKEMWDEGAFSVPLMAMSGPLSNMVGSAVGGSLGLTPELSKLAGTALVGGTKAGLSGGNPLLGAAMDVGSNYAMNKLLPGGPLMPPAPAAPQDPFTVMEFNSGPGDLVAGYNVEEDYFDTAARDDAFLGESWRDAADDSLTRTATDPKYRFGNDTFANEGRLGLKQPTSSDNPSMGGGSGVVAPAGTNWAKDYLPLAVAGAGAAGSFLSGRGGKTTLLNSGTNEEDNDIWSTVLKGLTTAGGTALDIATGAGKAIAGGVSSLLGNEGVVSKLFDIGTGLYGIKQADDTRDFARELMELSDPFASERGYYKGKLRGLMDDPSSLVTTPGYIAGQQAVERRMASNGYLGSGNMMTEMFDYGNKAFDTQVARLSSLAGAGATPGAGSNVAANTMESGNAALVSALNRIAYGIGGQ